MGRVYIDCRVRGQNVNQPLGDKLGQPLLRIYRNQALIETKVGFGADNCGYWDINDFDGDLRFAIDFTPNYGSSKFHSLEDFSWMVHSTMANTSQVNVGHVMVSHLTTQGKIGGEEELFFNQSSSDFKLPAQVSAAYGFSQFHDETIRFIVVWDYIRNLLVAGNTEYETDGRMYVKVGINFPAELALDIKQYNPADSELVMSEVPVDSDGYYVVMNEYHDNGIFFLWNDPSAMTHKRIRIRFNGNRISSVKQTLKLNSPYPQTEAKNKPLVIESDSQSSYVDFDTFLPKVITFESTARLKVLTDFNPQEDIFLSQFQPSIGDHFYGKNELVEISAPVMYKNDSMESAVFCKGATGDGIEDIVGSKATITVPEGDSTIVWNFELGKIQEEIRNTLIGNRSGYCALNTAGSIINALKLENDLLIYTTQGVYKVVPFTINQIVGYGCKKILEFGCVAVGGTESTHVLITKSGFLYTITPSGVNKLDYSEFFESSASSGAEIIISPLILKDLFYIQCGNSGCYILSKHGLTKTTVQTYQLFNTDTSYYGVTYAASSGTAITLVSGKVSLGGKGMKTIIGVEVDSENIANICLTIQPYYDLSTTEVTLPSHLVDMPLTRAFINTNISGREFKIKLTGISTGAANLNSVKLKWITVDQTISSGMEV